MEMAVALHCLGLEVPPIISDHSQRSELLYSFNPNAKAAHTLRVSTISLQHPGDSVDEHSGITTLTSWKLWISSLYTLML